MTIEIPRLCEITKIRVTVLTVCKKKIQLFRVVHPICVSELFDFRKRTRICGEKPYQSVVQLYAYMHGF